MTLGGTFKKTKKGLMLDGKFADWKDIVYVDMMSVRGSWQHNGINALMLKAVLASKRGKRRKLVFSKTTHAGQAFAEWWRAQGFDVTVEGEKPKKATRLLIDGEPV